MVKIEGYPAMVTKTQLAVKRGVRLQELNFKEKGWKGGRGEVKNLNVEKSIQEGNYVISIGKTQKES